MSQTSRDRVNNRRLRTHEKNSGDAVRRLGTIMQSIFCAQSGAGICLNFWKYCIESRYPGELSSRLFSRPDWLPPGSPRMVEYQSCVSRWVQWLSFLAMTSLVTVIMRWGNMWQGEARLLYEANRRALETYNWPKNVKKCEFFKNLHVLVG